MRFIGPPITQQDKELNDSVNKFSREMEKITEEFQYINDIKTINEYELDVVHFTNNPSYKIKKSLTKKMISSKLRIQKQREEKALKMIFDQNDIFYAGYSDAFRNFDNRDNYFNEDKENYIEGYEAGLVSRDDF